MKNLFSRAILAVIFAVALYVIFVIFSDITLLVNKFQNFNFLVLIPAFSLVLLSYFVRGFRWDFFLKTLDIDISLKKSLLLFFAGLGLSITPGKFGEVIKSHFLKKDYDHSYSKTAPIVFVERYYDLVGILIISLIGIWFTDIDRTIIFVALGIIIFALVISQQKKLVIKILGKFESISFLNKLARNSLETFETVHVLLKPKLYGKSLGYSVTAWLIESLAVFIIFLGFEIDISLPSVILIFTVSSIIGGLSMLPGGIGLTEGGMIGLLLLEGIDYTSAISVVIMVRIVTLWFSVIIGLIVLKNQDLVTD